MCGDAQHTKRSPLDSFFAGAISSKPVILSTNAVPSIAERGVGFPVVIEVATDDPNGDVPALATTPALTGLVDALLSRKSSFGGASQGKSRVGFDNNEVMIHDKEWEEIDLTGDDRTSKNSAWSPVQLGYYEIGGENTIDQLTKNTATNSSTLLQSESLNKRAPPVWQIGLHQARSSASAAISNPVWKQIRPFQDVKDIKKAITTF